MTPEELIGMANQIADFFSAYPEDEAIAGIAGHIRNFWDPRMRAELTRIVEAGGEGLGPQALAAARLIAEQTSKELG